MAGIITQQMLAGYLSYYKMTGPFAWTVSDGTVNLPVSVSGGAPSITDYFVVGDNFPVPGSAAEIALQTIASKCTIVIIGMVGTYGSITEIDFAVENGSMGWSSDTPPYSTPPADTPQDWAAAAAEMQAAVNALGSITVYVSVGGAQDPTATPVTATANLGTVVVTKVPFNLA